MTLVQESNFETAYSHSQLTLGNPHSVSRADLSIDTTDDVSFNGVTAQGINVRTISGIAGFDSGSISVIGIDLPLSFTVSTNTLSIRTATSVYSGALNADDWNTFNNKQTYNAYLNSIDQYLNITADVEFNSINGSDPADWDLAATNASLDLKTGFKEPENVIVTYSQANRTITLTGTVEAYYDSVLIPALVTGWVSDPHDAGLTNIILWLYYDGTNYIWTSTFPGFAVVLIAQLSYLGVTLGYHGRRECHGLESEYQHAYDHYGLGTIIETAMTSSGVTLDSITAAQRRPSFSASVLLDEDLKHTINADISKSYAHQWLTGTTNAALINANTGNADIIALSGERPYYNQLNAGTWQQTLLTTRAFTSVYVIGFPATADTASQTTRYKLMQGQNESVSKSAAAADIAAALEIQKNLDPGSLQLGNLAIVSPEMRVLYQYIVYWDGTNFTIAHEQEIAGTKKAPAVIAGSIGITSVAHDTSLDGNGTALNPLGIESVLKTNIDTAISNTHVHDQTLDTDSDVTHNSIEITNDAVINGNMSVFGTSVFYGDIIQQGSAYETHAEEFYTTKDEIITRDGAIIGLGTGAFTGILAKLYDGTNDGRIGIDKDGIVRIGDVGDEQAVATREDSPTSEYFAQWNDTEKRLDCVQLDASDISDFDTEVSNNTDVAANTSHRGLTSGNPHSVSKTEVGLSNVPNTDCTNADNISDGSTNAIVTLAQETNFETAYSNTHTHSNKANLDEINQDLATTDNVTFGNITSSNTSPQVILSNSTEEDIEGGRESAVIFKGKQSGAEESTLAKIQASHDGTGDDQKSDLIFYTNDGDDGDSPTERMRIDSSGNVGIGTTDPGTYKLKVTGTSHLNGATTVGTLFVGNGAAMRTGGSSTVFYMDLGTVYFRNGNAYQSNASLRVAGEVSIGDSYSSIAPPDKGLIVEGDVGIGTSSPVAKLHIEGARSGIGTNNGNARFLLNVDTNNNPSIELHRGKTGFNQASALFIDFGWDDDTDHNARIIMQAADTLQFIGSSDYCFNGSGDVGIGKTGPTTKLDVNGVITATSGNSTNWNTAYSHSQDGSIHLDSTQKTDLTDSGDSSLHYHSSDRDRSNHTGTQAASTISDFDTEVSNNTDVAANTSAKHTHSNKSILDAIQESFTTALKSAYDTAVSYLDQAVKTTSSPTFAGLTSTGVITAPHQWVKIAEANLEYDSSYTFSGLSGDDCLKYKITFNGLLLASNDNQRIVIRPNNDSTSGHYRSHLIFSGSASITETELTGLYLARPVYNDDVEISIECIIDAVGNYGRRSISNTALLRIADYDYVCRMDGVGNWENYEDEITSLVFASLNSGSFIGKVCLYKMVDD